MSDNLRDLKERIHKDQNIEKLLEELGCDNIKEEQGGTLITACHDGWNKRAVQVRNTPSLTSYIRNRGIEGDIFAIVGYLLYECETFDAVRSNLHQIKQWIINILEYDDFDNWYEAPKPKVDWNWWLRPIQQQRMKEIHFSENTVLDERFLKQYVQYPWLGWIDEGITYEAQQFFQIGFDVYSERVTIPIRNKEGKLISAKGRYYGHNKDIEDQYKYLYLHPCNKSVELFNLHNALPHIKEKKECLVFEAAKTVIKLWGLGVKNCVSMEGDRLSPVQAKMIKDTGLDVEPVFAWDKDKDEEFVRGQVKQIKGRKMSYLLDTVDIFGEKESPGDRGIEDFLQLYNECRVKIC